MKKIFLLLLIASIACSSCSTKTDVTAKILANVSKDSKENFKEVIPFKFKNGSIIIEASLDGVTGDYWFDTGSRSAVPRSARSRILKAKKWSKLGDFQIGKVLFQNSKIDIWPPKDDFRTRCYQVDGIIGANTLKDFIWQIDFEKQTIAFTNTRDSIPLPDSGEVIYFFERRGGVPTVAVYIDSVYCREVSFDTQNSRTLSLSYDYMPDSCLATECMILNEYGRRLGHFEETLALIPRMELRNSFVLDSQLVDFKSIWTSGSIGTGLMKNYRVTFDWKEGEIIMERTKTAHPKPIEEDFGFEIVPTKGKFIVAYIRKNSSAYKNGLRLKDQILSVNGTELDKGSDDLYCWLYHQKVQLNSLEMVIKRKKEILDMRVYKESLTRGMKNTIKKEAVSPF